MKNGQRRYCPDCDADLFTRSCGHFPMGSEGDEMRDAYLKTAILPDKARVAELHQERCEAMLKFYHDKGDNSWDAFYADQIRAWGTVTQ